MLKDPADRPNGVGMQQETKADDRSPTRRGTRRWRRGERGVVAVETALMVPLLFFVFFGMMEFGLYWMADHSLNEGARTGARLGATLARELNYEDDVVAVVEDAVRGKIPSGTVDALTIFRADPTTGSPYAGTGTVDDCSADCFRYVWDSDTEAFAQVAGPAWDALSQAACGRIDHNDYLGVYIEGTYESLTGIFPAGRTISESSIIRLEPVPLSGTCEP